MSRSRKGGRATGARRDNSSISPDGLPSTKPVTNGKKPSATAASPSDTLPALGVTPAQPMVRRRFTLKRVLIGIAIAVVVLIGGGLGYAYWTVQRAMPTINGSAGLPGL